MSYPSIGMAGLGIEQWDAAAIEKLLREGKHIYIEEDCAPCGGTGGDLVVAQFVGGTFKLTGGFDFNRDEVIYENASFVEFAVWVAFGGRDFL